MPSFYALKRRPLASLLAFALLLTVLPLLADQASAGTDSTEIVAPSGIVVSGRADRVDPQPIENVQLAGDVFIFMDVSRNVRKATYFLDDPQGSNAPFRVSDTHPFDLEGVSGDQARPFDTMTLDDGVYTLTVNLDLANGRIHVFHAAVVVANGGGAPEVPGTDPAPDADPAPGRDLEPVEPDIDRVVSGEHDGFTVPVGQTWQVEHVTTTANVIVEGTLRMRPDSSLTFTDVDNSQFVGGGMGPVASDVGLWVMGSGVLDIQGTPVQGWNRTGIHPTWKSEHEYVAAPLERGTVTGQPWDFGDPVPCVEFDAEDYCTEIVNLTRDVVIESVDGGQAHVFIRSDQPQTIRYAAIRRMSPQIDDTAPDGRYALHFHHSGDGSRGSLVEGVVVRDSGDHAFAPHLSHGITFRDTVAYNVVNTAYWWDEGASEATHDIRFERALALEVHTGRERHGALGGFRMGRGLGNACIECVAAGVSGGRASAGFSWHNAASRLDDNLWEFRDSVAHNNDQGVWHWYNEPKKPSAHQQHGFVGYHNLWHGIEQGAYNIQSQWFDTVLFGNGAREQNNPAAVQHRGHPRGEGTVLSYEHGTFAGGDHVVSISKVAMCPVESEVRWEYLHLLDWNVTPIYVHVDTCDPHGGQFRHRFKNVVVGPQKRDLTRDDFTVQAIPPGGIITVERTDGHVFTIEN